MRKQVKCHWLTGRDKRPMIGYNNEFCEWCIFDELRLLIGLIYKYVIGFRKQILIQKKCIKTEGV